MTPASSRRFFTAFYDVLSRYRQPFPPLGPAACINRSYATRHPPTSSFFFGASPFSTPRSRYVVSRGFAGFCVCSSVPGTAGPTTSVAASTVVAETTGSSVLMGKRGGILARLGLRGIHTPRKKRRAGATGTAGQRRRNKSSDALSRRRAAAAEKAALEAAGVEEKVEMKALPAPAKEPPVQGIFERVYHIHRPTKDEMLAAATGMWQRIRIRTKWSLIRQMRPYSLEDITAFFSWMLLGHVVWVVVGTTTFLSVAIFLVNSVFAQGMCGRGGVWDDC